MRLLAGIIPVKSPKMAKYMNENVPGIEVPEALITRIAESSDRAATSSEAAAAVISEIRPMCRGVHVMAIGWEDKVARHSRSRRRTVNGRATHPEPTSRNCIQCAAARVAHSPDADRKAKHGESSVHE